MNTTLNPRDQITVKHSPYVWRVIRTYETVAGTVVVAKKPGDDRTGRRSQFPIGEVLSIVERAR